MRKTRKALNLVALIGFLGSNFLTPLAYAQTDISEEVSGGAESQSINVPLGESGNDEIGEGIPSDEERIPPTPLIKGGNPKDGGITLTEGGLEQSEGQENLKKGPTLRSVGDAQLNWTEGEDFFTISIAKPEGVTDDGPAGFTIMDRNLGATTNEVDTTYGSYTNGTGSYGYHYQWGNNYGFAQGCTISSQWGSCNDTVTANPTGLEWNTDYNNSGYYSTDLINGSSLDYDVWSDSSHHDGVWGGAGDNASNNWGANEDNPTDRQGPCPSGYHVPSAGEWGLLIKYWAYASGYDSLVDGSEGLYYIDGETARTDFMDYFKLPFAGSRNYYSASLNYQGSYGHYWSSSPNSASSNYARFLYLNSSYVYASSYYDRAYGFSVRCFKDSYVAPSISYTLELHANGGSVTTGTLETDNEGKVTLPTASRDADVNGERVFEGWFAGEGVSEKIGNPGDEITLTADMEVYAHWAQTITIRDPANPLSGFTIMDRNLGATTDDITNTDSYGFHYQWGNNYGFLQSLDKTANPEYFTGTRATYDSYGPANPYSNPLFRRGNSMYDYWDTSSDHYDNLWGGGSDTTANNWGLNLNNPTDRQGPCPADYHVPSAGEWSKLLEYWAKTNEDNYTGLLVGSYQGLKTVGVCIGEPTCYDENDDVVSCDEDFWYFDCDGDYGSLGDDFADYFNLSFAGGRGYLNASLDNRGSYGIYWSSSPDSASSSSARGLHLDSSNVDASNYYYRAYGYSVRCFKDSYVAPISYTLTFDSQGGDEVATGVAVENTSRSRPENPSKSGYTFVDWYTSTGYESAFDFTGTLATGNLIVYAKWADDVNDNGIADEDEDHFTLTIHYVNSKGGEVFADYTGSYVSGASYNVASTEKEHYTIDKATISGVMGNADVEETVTYSTETPDTNDNGIADEDEDHFTLTIHYVNSKGGEVFADYTGSYVSGASYNVASTEKEHYTIDKATISGVMGNADVEETVTYSTETPDTNDNGIADEDEDHFTLTIHYVNSKGGEVFADYTGSYVSGANYNVVSTEKEHYTIDKATISGVMGNSDVEETVIYTANNDKNNNGVADEDEGYKPSGGSSGGGGSSNKTNDTDKDKESLNNEPSNNETLTGDNNVDNEAKNQTGSNKDNEGEKSESNSGNTASYNQELIDAYNWAKGEGITTMPTIQKAKVYDNITREQLAKMMVVFVSKVLGKQPVTNKTVKYKDVSVKLRGEEFNNYIQLAYQYQIMGIDYKGNPIKYFNPSGEVTRAEFATVLSRVLFGNKYNQDGKKYYEKHIKALEEAGILTNTDPSIKELRGWIMLMLYRSLDTIKEIE